jgi:hypothetical protein
MQEGSKVARFFISLSPACGGEGWGEGGVFAVKLLGLDREE